MKKLLLMVVCFAGLVCYAGANATASTGIADRTTEMARDSSFMNPYISIVYEPFNAHLNQDGMYLYVSDNDAPLYVEIAGDASGTVYVPAGGARIKLLSEYANLYVVRWYWE